MPNFALKSRVFDEEDPEGVTSADGSSEPPDLGY